MMQYGTIYPIHQVKYCRSTAAIVCPSKKQPSWRKLGQPLPEVFNLGSKLVFHNLKEEDSGIYICCGYETDNKSFTAISELLVGGILTL